MSLPRYPEYKASGVEWLGEVPGHWDVKPLRRLVSRTNAGEVIDRTYWGGTNEILYSCALEPLDCDYEGFPDWKRTTANDLLLTRNGTPYIHKPVPNAIYTNVVQRISLMGGEDRDYLATALQNSAANLKGYGVSIESLNYDMWKSLPVAIPPRIEQTQIVTFLDRETGKIDALIAEQRRLVELLAEKRQAVISHAVTKGLNTNAKMKDSGIEWLGEVPEHWNVMALKRDLAFLTSGSRGWADHYADEGALFIRIGNLPRNGIHLDLSDIQRVNVPEGAEGERTKVIDGDVLFSITAYLGSVAIVPDNLEVAYVSQHVALARLSGQYFLPRWVAYLTLSLVGKTYLETQGYGGTKIQLSLDDIKNIPTLAPSLDEQQVIVSFLEIETAKLDTLTAEANRAIELLQERRSALISAAVTGKIDVRKTM